MHRSPTPMMASLFFQLFALFLYFASTFAAADEAAEAPVSESLAAIQRASNQSLLWGPYRPNLYFGMRPRIPKSLMTGLMWVRMEDYQKIPNNFRHTCEQHEGMAGYGWDQYDPRHGGVQTIHDDDNGLDVETSLVKYPNDGSDAGSWAVRVRGTPRPGHPKDLKSSVLFYAGFEGLDEMVVREDVPGFNEDGFSEDVTIDGEGGGLGPFRLTITGDAKTKNKHPAPHNIGRPHDLRKTFVRSFHVDPDMIWRIKEIFYGHLKSSVTKYMGYYDENMAPPPWHLYVLDHEVKAGNLQLVQKVFEGAFEFDVIFTSGESREDPARKDLKKALKQVTSAFSTRFSKIFPPQAPFKGGRYEECSKSLLSNLLGGIGYFFGDSRVDRSYAPEYEEDNEMFWEEAAAARASNEPELEGPSELFTSIPSRPFFPRGFLWDEGFHLLPILDWDVDLTLEIIKSWFNLIDEDGWIAREQILGPEARSKVPLEFQVQYPHYANPPTLFMVLSEFVKKLSQASPSEKSAPPSGDELPEAYLTNHAAAKEYLTKLYPLLKRQYFWFRRTQKGDINTYDREASNTKEAYRWRGRTVEHILPSGLDDYPRAQPPHPGELHIDAISWVGMMSKALKDIATYLGEEDDQYVFARHESSIGKNINDLHWSANHSVYCDATIDDFEEHVHVCHKGYISLFPFLVGLLDPKRDAEKIGAMLKLIGDENELWSEHGIRSLSKKDRFYDTGENYWRSPVWVNINYMVVARLLELAQTSNANQNRATDLYTRLRKNLVNTVYESWKETGFAWEQYDPETGKGQRTQHFTGWTSLVVKIMAMPNLEGKGKSEL